MIVNIEEYMAKWIEKANEKNTIYTNSVHIVKQFWNLSQPNQQEHLASTCKQKQTNNIQDPNVYECDNDNMISWKKQKKIHTNILKSQSFSMF